MPRNFGLIDRAPKERGLTLVTKNARAEAYGDVPHLDVGPLADLDRDANHDLRCLVVGIITMFAIVAALIAGCVRVRARDDGQRANSPLKAWFDKLASGKGLCCSFADGLTIEDVDWDTNGAGGRYRVRIDGQWIEVPDAALVAEPNRFGPAVVWPYQDAEGVTQIRCFLPGAGA